MTPIKKTRLETELLLLCVSPVRDERRNARIHQLLNQQPDWNYLESLADSHSLLPLLCWELKAARPDIVPPSMAAKFRHNLQNSIFLTGALFRIVALLHPQGPPPIPLHRPTLPL